MHITAPRRRLERPGGSALRGICLIAVLAALGGCGGGGGGGTGGGSGSTDTFACTAELRASVVLTVVDQANVTLPGVSVSYQVDGGATQTKTCDSGAACALAYEVAGTFLITAAKAGYSPASATVAVTRDRCHVNTESLTLRLAPTA